MPPPPVCLADRHAGVRTNLGEQLASAGVARVVAEAGTLAQARRAAAALPAGGLVVSGLAFPDGSAAGLLGGAAPVVVYTWLPPDEREVDLTGAAAVVGIPVGPGLVAVLAGRAVP